MRLRPDTFRLFIPSANALISGGIGLTPPCLSEFRWSREAVVEQGRDHVMTLHVQDRMAAWEAIENNADRSFVLIFAATDGAFLDESSDESFRIPKNVDSVFCINSRSLDPRITPYPLGVRYSNVTTLSAVKEIACREQFERDILCYMNFTYNSDHYGTVKKSWRSIVAGQFSDKSWVTNHLREEGVSAALSMPQYYAQLSRSKFVLSPPGNGMDCYRHWEAITLGAIPIVRNEMVMGRFAELPILYTEDYSEITEDYLLKEYEEITSRTHDYRQMFPDFYKTKLMEAIGALSDPKFILFSPVSGPEDAIKRRARSHKHLALLARGAEGPSMNLSTEPRCFGDGSHAHGTDIIIQPFNGAEVAETGEGKKVECKSGVFSGAQIGFDAVRSIEYEVTVQWRGIRKPCIVQIACFGIKNSECLVRQKVKLGRDCVETTIRVTAKNDRLNIRLQCTEERKDAVFFIESIRIENRVPDLPKLVPDRRAEVS